jgi:hypothetical protein
MVIEDAEDRFRSAGSREQGSAIRPERGENGTFEDLAFVRRRSLGFILLLTVACGKALPAEWNGEATNERQHTPNQESVHALTAAVLRIGPKGRGLYHGAGAEFLLGGLGRLSALPQQDGRGAIQVWTTGSAASPLRPRAHEPGV